MKVEASKTDVKEIVLYRCRNTFLSVRIKERLGTYVYFCRFGSRELRKFHLMASFFNGKLETKQSAESKVEKV